ncbi:aminotransferase class-V [Aspergillus sclerotioniger CBS 115572]|uniref:Aminotransferase class-V n=1 Tax=Aspergillus sclerotioniger CBS 115572 TaxID=1450535 RepID=A0A317V1W6_9EURO|nr:aminotransferase class-V [Aspergillus sclerotioniger CBS 115572]PWY67996.1 aminotransferase class-V [Aspergillus sclerotioniger CBS 115572]
MSTILETFPEYADTALLDHLRETEYNYLDEQGQTYLDYTGSGLAAKSQYNAHNARLTEHIFGNPHSVSPTSENSTRLVEQARSHVLAYLNATPDTYTAIFTQNATGAARLVGEAYPFTRQKTFILTEDNHNSVNGIREFARARNARTVYVTSQSPELRVNPAVLAEALGGHWWEWGLDKMGIAKGGRSARERGLFAYPAQSNLSGVRHPLEWVTLAQECGYDVLLDAAAYLPTNRLDLSDGNPQPDFVMVSWYKLFGYPTGLGCLIARRDALSRLSRPWFSGGSVLAAGVVHRHHTLAADEVGFEDGTLNFLSIPDVQVGLEWLERIDMTMIATRVRCLTGWFLQRLLALRHSDGAPMAEVYGPTDLKRRGGTVCFNFLDSQGKIVDERLVAHESAAASFSLRTGCFCNPGGMENAFGLDARLLRRMRRRLRKVTTIDGYIHAYGLPSGGAVRVSFGLASNVADVDRFFEFAIRTYRDRVTDSKGLSPRLGC